MKPFNRIISLLMVLLMLITSVPYENIQVSAASDEEENYTLTLENTYEDSFAASNSATGGISFFGDTGFNGCYGNQLSGVAKEFYDSMADYYAANKNTGEYTHTFEAPFTFNAEISGNSIVMNDELEEISLTINYAMQVAMDAFLYDHPELFWLRVVSSSYSISASGNSADGYVGTISTITITPTEIYSGAASKISQYDEAVNAAISAITVTESRYDTLKNVHDYICNNAYYNLIDDYYVHSSEAFFIGDGGVVCEGYAKAFKVLCDELEIPCVLVSGDADGAHMWNYVQMDDDKWYLVDATWDDQESKIYDTYFLANANTVGFNDVVISEERTEKTDFSGTGYFSFTYPELSTTAYIVHTHKWESEYTVDKAATCTREGSKSKHCTRDGCTAKTSVTAIAKLAHTNKTTTTKATLSKNGKAVTACTVCGNVSKTTTIYYPKTITLSATSYTYNGKTKTPSVTVKDSKGNTLKKDTDYTVKYESGRKVPGKYTVTITFKGNYTGTKKLYFTIAPKVTSKITATQTTSTITLKWNKVTGADGYRVYKYNSKTKKYEKLKDVTGTSLKISKLKAGTAYKYKVRAYTKDDGTIWGGYSSVFETATKPKTPTLKVTSTSKGKVTFSWTNISGESGYQVYYSTKKDSGFKKVKSYKTNVVKGSKSKLKSGKKYYFKVRAYKKTASGTVYSSWSSVKSIKIK